MKVLELTLEAEEPLVITDGSAESMAHSCLEYIPGSMLLGAFASAWIRKNKGDPDASPVFQGLFLSGAVSWGCAYPLCGGEATVPVPFCYMREKSKGGLPVYGLEFDPDKFLIFNPLALPSRKDGDEALHELWREKVGDGVKPKFKKLSADFMSPALFRQPDIHLVWNTRVALGQKRAALEAQLFGFSAMAAGTRLRCRIYCRSIAMAAELDKLCSLGEIRVGHARSAGYGLVRLQSEWKNQEELKTARARSHDIFLRSDYLPEPVWENPLANLVAKLQCKYGAVRRDPEKTFTSFTQIEGFCGQWQKPRDSRTGLAKGGVLRLEFESPVELPTEFELGGGNLEGYGRIMADPAFLGQPVPEIPTLAGRETRKGQAVQIKSGAPFWQVLRKRALARAIKAQSMAWLEDKRWQGFLTSVGSQDVPTLAQISNLLEMAPAIFKSMLDKTPGRQWQETGAANPFGTGREYLDVIISNLLDQKAFLQAFPTTVEPVLPGNATSAEERREFEERSHALFRRALIRAWIKNLRSKEE